jgi:crossover junction endodeoxyribonuclease RusA
MTTGIFAPPAPARRQLIVIAHGTPRPQGSKTRGAAGAMREASKGLPYWRDVVKLAAMRARAATGWETVTGVPVRVDQRFYLERPAVPEHPDFPLGPPDQDKLARAVNDALTQAGVLADDALIVDARVIKIWAQPGQPPYARIEIEVLEP